jgi:hypothetical protein
MEPVISDFGLSRSLEGGHNVAETKSDLGPVKHMAIESIRQKLYSEKVNNSFLHDIMKKT